ncbi:MAG: protein kinase domain-containing protein [Gemmatimonadaceae bacterium]
MSDLLPGSGQALRDQLQASLGSAYTLERELGGGGMSRVFVAEEARLRRKLVVKVLLPELAAGVSAERFQREIELAASLQQANIVPVITAGETDGLPYYMMPFVDGLSLRARLERNGALPVGEAMSVLRDVTRALAYAHERGVVHRDIKPENILLSGDAAVVTDFGIAKALSASRTQAPGGTLTQVGTSIGTPAYMAPEQAAGDPDTDHRADLYALGCVAYEMLAGAAPFAGRPTHQLFAAHLTEIPGPLGATRPDVPRAIAQLVARLLEKDPARRPQSAREVLHALDGATKGAGAASALPSSRGRIATIAAIAAGLVIITSVAFAAWRNSQRAGDVDAANAPRSIAVLPLENIGGDTATQFFADGMTDELTSTVAKIAGLKVASRSATMAALKVFPGDTKALGQRLSVGAVLVGRIRRSGERMRLTAELSSVHDGSILWSETYDRDAKDAFQVQDEVARAIASALRVTLGDGQRRLAAQRTVNPEAHDLYLRGRYILEKYTEPDIRTALVLFEQAVAKDPQYAAAWSGIADSWGMLADDFMAPREAMQKMRDAMARAATIDSTSPELLFVRGNTALWYDRDPVLAERLMGEALRASPDQQFSTSYYSMALWVTGMRDSATAFVRHEVARDPTSPEVLNAASTYFLKVGDRAAARTYCDRLVEMQAGEGCSATVAMAEGRPEQAIPIYRKRAANPDIRVARGARASLVRALALSGQAAEARQLAMTIDAEARSGGRYFREDTPARMWSYLGDYDRAFEWMERALRSGSSGIGVLYWTFATDPIRKDPRMRALAKRAGLPDPPPYW